MSYIRGVRKGEAEKERGSEGEMERGNEVINLKIFASFVFHLKSECCPSVR
jgi:hypothetical protein